MNVTEYSSQHFPEALDVVSTTTMGDSMSNFVVTWKAISMPTFNALIFPRFPFVEPGSDRDDEASSFLYEVNKGDDSSVGWEIDSDDQIEERALVIEVFGDLQAEVISRTPED